MNDLQNKILDIFKVVKTICDKHNIRYFAIGGTAIGAERHSGFIPWDDDFDIAMPNKDFKRFVRLCDSELPSNLKLFLPSDSKHSLIFWAKIHDVNTAFLEKGTYMWEDYKYGVFIDIMPMYGLPSGKELKKYIRKTKRYKTLSLFKKASFGQLTLKDKLFSLFLKPLNLFVETNYWLNKLEKYQAKYDFDDCESVGYTWWYALTTNTIFDRKFFDDFYVLPFEDTFINCCSGNKECLTLHFGNYMELPPVEERVTHHSVFKIDLKNSYKKYNSKGELEP